MTFLTKNDTLSDILKMSKGIIKTPCALPPVVALFCLASCASVDSKVAEPSPSPVEEAADELHVLMPHEVLPGHEDHAFLPEHEGHDELHEHELPEEEAVSEPPVEEAEPEVAEAEPEPIIEEKAEEEPPPPIEEDDANEVVAVVDDVPITKQEHLQTKSEVEAVVEDLNKITREKDYVHWITYLDEDYKSTLSNRGYLAQITKSLPKALRSMHVQLVTIRDYFDYVFVPSRQNVRVDDIQYITPTRVYVIMEMRGGKRAAVYILEKESDGSWKLVDKH